MGDLSVRCLHEKKKGRRSAPRPSSTMSRTGYPSALSQTGNDSRLVPTTKEFTVAAGSSTIWRSLLRPRENSVVKARARMAVSGPVVDESN